ncbi:DUF423 domain-containing protein [Catenovulum maritimum]|uniref:DUF423 domain-containing protein n=1 Tax=Catenovulum maritimum TaxID=1513271 RepID=A0A0J8GX26_9ALTE|nr:DUF423 domain-containing protein [Catenovulum maritimum]KMT65258.1 hypothetical protein XM47_09460 [Catenovulum maritimum]
MPIFNRILFAGFFFGLTAVILGAFGAHALKPMLTTKEMEVFDTAVNYQFTHAFALISVAICYRLTQYKQLKLAAIVFCLGILGFSGTLYLWVLTGKKWLAMLTPLGGSFLIMGWVLLIIFAFKYRPNK